MADALFDDDGQFIPADWDLPPAIRARLGQTVGRQRIMAEAGHVLVILHRVPAPEEHERRACVAWKEPSGRWRGVDERDGRLSLRETLSEYKKALAIFDDQLELRLEIDQHFEILEQLAPITRSCRHVHATLQAARDTCRDDRSIIDLRDQAYALERRAELLAGDARFALDRALARSSHEHTIASRHGAEATDRLNRLAATFLPIGTLAALLGMNLPSGLEGLTPPWPFIVVALGGLAVGMLLSQRIHRAS